MKRRGSAIIISMLLISAIGVIAFSIGRLLFWEVSAASAYENGSIAYYAAESGIEEGFLRYRFNQNTEIPYGNSNSFWTLGDNKVFRNNLANPILPNAVNLGIDNTGVDPVNDALYPINRDEQYFDLRIGYIGTNGLPFYGQDIDIFGSGEGKLDANDIKDQNYSSGEYSFLTVPKDEAYKIDLTDLDLASNSLTMVAQFNQAGIGTDATGALRCKALFEIKFIVKDPSGISKEYKDLLNYNSSTCSSVLVPPISQSKMTDVEGNYGSIGSDGFYYVKQDLRDILSKAGAGYPVHSLVTPNPQVSLYLKPLNYNAKIGLTINGCAQGQGICVNKNKVITGPYTNVESTGYFGGSSRKLLANIDRQSGTVYDLFDYVVYIK